MNSASSEGSEPGLELTRSNSVSGPPELRRERSNELRRAEEEAIARDPPPLVRQSSEEMVNRFHGMKSWEDSDHPIGKNIVSN
jgi:hypothetical protein